MNKREAAVISAYTGILCGKMEWVHKYAEEALGRPVFTHEFAFDDFTATLKEAARFEFITICQQAIENEE